MPAVTLNPFPVYTAFDANGRPLNGGLVYTYRAGTMQPLGTFDSPTGAAANAYPLVLTTSGFAAMFLQTGIAYKVRQLDAAGNVLWTVDDIVPVPSGQDITDIQNVILTMKGTADWTVTTRIKTIQADLLFAGGTPGQWDHGVNTTIFMALQVPYDIAPGPITFRWLRRSLSTGGLVAVMSTQSQRNRDNSAPFFFDTGTAANFQPFDTNTHEFDYVIAAGANYAIGDTLVARLIRFGTDVGDSLLSTVVYDGGWISYTAYASR